MHSTIINGIQVEYTFNEGRMPAHYDDEGREPSVTIKSTTIEGTEAYAFIQSCTAEDDAYEFSSTMEEIEALVLEHHLSHCR